MNLLRLILPLMAAGALPFATTAGEKLSGIPIGTSDGYNYSSWSVEKDIQYRAFDGDLDTYFATDARSYTWVGLDLGEPYVIDRVGWSPRNDELGPGRVLLGVIQGANSDDFLDAIPIYIITEKGVIGQMSHADVDCSRGFRYVRYVSTADSRCNIAELEFYGTPGAGDDSHLFQVTNLPTVAINTVDSQEPFDKETDIKCNVIIIDGNATDVDKPATVRERGNGSRQFPKKPWRIKFDKKQNVLDAPAKAKKWTLINNYGDKTLMRNILAFEIARRLEMPFVSWCQPVDVILNGEYKGCYQLCDQMEVNPGRLEITEMDENDTAGDALTGGYFIEVDAYAAEEPEGSWFYSGRKGIPVTIKSPDDGGTPEQRAYITKFFNDVESKLFGRKFGADGGEDYRDVFDVESYVRHFIVNELAGNTDTYWSTYMYKDRLDPQLHTGPAWDFDLGFDNDNRTYPIHNHAGDYLYRFRGSSAANGMKDFADGVLRSDARTKDEISRIWSIARNEHDLSYESLAGFVDGQAEVLDRSQRLNFVRWPILSQYVHQNPRALGSYSAEVEAVKDYLRTRVADLDRLFAYDPAMSGEATPEPAQDKPHVSGSTITVDGATPFGVWTADGRQVYSGCGPTPDLTAGLYIVRTATTAAKVVVRAH